MIIKNIFILILASFIANDMIESTSSSFEFLPKIPENKSLCLIKNVKYTNEYLYGSFDLDFTWHRKAFTNHLDPSYMRSPIQSVWFLQPINKKNKV